MARGGIVARGEIIARGGIVGRDGGKGRNSSEGRDSRCCAISGNNTVFQSLTLYTSNVMFT